MISPENSTQNGNPDMLKNAGATPRQLVQHQIENFDYHVTDEDIENMIISTELSEHDKSGSNEEADTYKKDNTGTSYDMINE